MSGLFSGWRKTIGALVMAVFGGTSVTMPALGADLEPANETIIAASSLDDGYAMMDDDPLSSDEILYSGRYAPAPPHRGHHRRWRPYRPHWNFRIVPPPIFAPGWFALYFMGQPPPQQKKKTTPPVRRKDFRHVNDYSFGVALGGYYGAYREGEEYTDPGARFTLQYRNTPVVGAELAVGMFGTNMRPSQPENARSDLPIQLSAMLHMFPRAPIQPYILFGGTGNIRNYQHLDSDGTWSDPYTELRVGPHIGVGVEILVGERVGMSLDARRVFYTLVDRNVIDQTEQNDATVTGGLNFYF